VCVVSFAHPDFSKPISHILILCPYFDRHVVECPQQHVPSFISLKEASVRLYEMPEQAIQGLLPRPAFPSDTSHPDKIRTAV
jgi:hypothetical protein